MKVKTLIATLAVSSMMAGVAGAVDISGAGATFPYPIYAKWADAYKKETGTSLNYQSIGSGGGIKQIKAKTVDFGASDMPLDPKDLEASGLMQFPMVMGGVVPVYNIKGIDAGKITMSGKLLGDIYLAKVKKWNDPEIAKENPGVKLPDQAINVVHRSDGSGTTFIFTNYLGKVNPDWASKVGANTSVQWPTGIGGKGNEGVANYVKTLDGALGYVEYAYALQNKLAYAKLVNKAGKTVAPEASAFAAAAANADWAHTPAFAVLLTDQPGDESWPIAGATFILMYKKQDKPENAKEVLKFFDWSYQHGDKMAMSLDYIPMPENVSKLVEETWMKEIAGPDGKPVYDGKM